MTHFPSANDDGSRPIFTWVAAVDPDHWHEGAMEEIGELRDCSQRCIDLASLCRDPDIAGILLEVADDLERDAAYIEHMSGNGPAKGQPARRAGDMPIPA
jgi:hypothetical protein